MPEPAVRLLQHPSRQRAHRGRPVAQARADRRGGARGVGLGDLIESCAVPDGGPLSPRGRGLGRGGARRCAKDPHPMSSLDVPTSRRIMITRMTGGDAIVQSLLLHGVDTVFGIPGVQTYHLFDAFARAGERIKVIGPRHEQTTAYMAFGYAKSTGKVGVYSVVPGPGVLNSTAALCSAYGASTPILCLTGQVPAAFIGSGKGHLHELPDQLATLRTLTKWAARIEHPAQKRRSWWRKRFARCEAAGLGRSHWKCLGTCSGCRRRFADHAARRPSPHRDGSGCDRAGSQAAQGRTQPHDHGRQRRDGRIEGGARTGRAAPGAGGLVPRRTGRGERRSLPRIHLRRRLQALARDGPADRHRLAAGAAVVPLARPAGRT